MREPRASTDVDHRDIAAAVDTAPLAAFSGAPRAGSVDSAARLAYNPPAMDDAITDVPGIRVGHWTDRAAATGCTVVIPENGAMGGVEVRGGAPGTHETDPLLPGRWAQQVHAVLLSGGSAFGLAATAGVMRWLEEQGRGVTYAGLTIPLVPAAILFDLNVGRSDVRPGPEGGYAACAAARAGAVEQGSVGAGTGATVAKALGMEHALKGGVGTASERGPGGLVVGAIVACNAAGGVVDADTGELVAGPRSPDGGLEDPVEVLRQGRALRQQPAQNTTIAVVATNLQLSKEQACRLAGAAHDGMARAVRPVHGLTDGDTVFALATGDLAPAPAPLVAVEALAARALERAILRSVLLAEGLAGIPAVRDLRNQ